MKGTRTKKQKNSSILGKFHFISGSTVKINTYLLFCHFPCSSWPTWKWWEKRIQLISHASLAQITLFTSTSALVNKVLGSRATVGHSSYLLNQRKSHRPSLFISAFSIVFFKTPCSIKLKTVFFKTSPFYCFFFKFLCTFCVLLNCF